MAVSVMLRFWRVARRAATSTPDAKTPLDPATGRRFLRGLTALPAPGVVDHIDDVTVVFVDQIDLVVDQHPARSGRREAEAEGAPVVQLVAPEDRRQVLAFVVTLTPVAARHLVVAVAGREI